ncbi:hypothetical protein Rsub_02637 [Raphidocelis subcapitata]|uniref:AB hydrolase-1 domain-containing protein n=1 Tax=Raphidocelis subcapitata TaxID=307507 RepID=A0A2V0NWJ3_9CHLO|nr:hypothetical protein Rsub_02637 [Raphidocelis subcapitata]|eukprot:GBF89933.1 hypothetical protein Rsub_02637 [Raphidocelis subcapitata]
MLSARLPVLIGLLAVLLALPEPGTIPGPLVRTNLHTPNTTDLDTPLYTRRNVGFPCSGVRCEAWLYTPKRSDGAKPPLVLLAHGMGGQRDTGLHKYSSYFADAGLAVFTFDYRGFGGSEGEPRHWVSPSRHLADWQSAFDYVTGESSGDGDPIQEQLLEAVDSSRIILWGTSFAGGHALVMASQLGHRIKGVVAQVPHLNATAATLASIQARGPLKSVRMLLLGLKDLARHVLGMPPVYVPLAGPPGSLALMQLEEGDMTHYAATRPAQPQGGWRNMACARLSAELLFKKYSPIKFIPDIEVPVLFVASSEDKLCPFEQVQAGLSRARRGYLIARDVSHFQLTGPAQLPSLMTEQVTWVLERLAEEGDAAAAGAHEAAERAAAAAAAAAEAEVGAGEATVE